jgi:biotin transport system substrate-specific component
MAAARRTTSTDLALIAGFAALIAACALLPTIEVGIVDITLQTFAVLLAGAALGAKRGFLAALLYVVVGTAGMPIFSGGGAGYAVLTGPSGGYLVGFPLAAGLCGFLVERLPRHKVATSVPLIFLAGLVGSFAFIHPLGIAGLVLRADMTWTEAFRLDLTFWLGDAIKNAAMALVATAVHRAFPDLLPRRRTAQQAESTVPTHTPA